jgi:hypothetical protein
MTLVAAVDSLGFAAHRSSPNFVSLLANPLIWSMAGFGAGIYLFFRGFALLRRKRFLGNIPQTTIRGASLGLVEVSGKVEGPYTIIAPFSASDCFYYRAIARTSSEQSGQQTAEEKISAPFFLNDGTGNLLIDARGAQTELPSTFSEEYSGAIPDFAQRFLVRHGISPLSGARLEEYAVRAGDTLFAMGTLRENTPHNPVAWDTGGFLSPEAAEFQREEAMGGATLPGSPRPKIVAEQASSEFELHPPVLLAGESNRPLFLSARSQREIVEALALKSTAYIWGGPILTLVCFWYLLSQLGYL